VRSVAREIEADVSRLVTENVTLLKVSSVIVALLKLLLLRPYPVLRTAAIRIKDVHKAIRY
jgi:hypothetical protein